MADATGAITLDASKIITTFDIDKPEVRAKLFRIRGNQGMNFFAILESLGYSRAVTKKFPNSTKRTGSIKRFTLEIL